MKMWAGRFRQPLDPGFERWQRSFEFDRRLLAYEIAASRAHARALKNAGIVSSDELISILQGLDQITEQAAMSPAFLDDDEAEDVHHFVEKQLVVMIGDVGYKLHSGRSRNEQIATDLRLYVRASIDDLRLKLAEWLDALVSRAGEGGHAPMPRLYASAACRAGVGVALGTRLCRDVFARCRTRGGLPCTSEYLSSGFRRSRRYNNSFRSTRDC